MTQESEDKKTAIISMLKGKSLLKQKIYDNMLQVFETLKDILREFARETNHTLSGSDSRIKLEFTDRGI
ncbi:MAG TPA: hypothetical protein P5257_09110, partial [Bacteroidales bacterium]|nr:hypothetical protein [Bacteroidales bacterium]